MPKRPHERLRRAGLHLEGQRVAQVIRSYREANGWSMRGLAKEAGVALGTIQRLERGELVVQIDIFVRVLNALGVDTRELLEGSVQPPVVLTLEETVKKAADENAIPELLSAVAQHWPTKRKRS